MTDNEKSLFGIDKLNIKRSEIPAVTHVDYSARIQTVNKETNPKYHKLISEFKKKSGCPVIGHNEVNSGILNRTKYGVLICELFTFSSIAFSGLIGILDILPSWRNVLFFSFLVTMINTALSTLISMNFYSF